MSRLKAQAHPPSASSCTSYITEEDISRQLIQIVPAARSAACLPCSWALELEHLCHLYVVCYALCTAPQRGPVPTRFHSSFSF
ncbi:hypothetical protein FIBSPDRAFT_877993, partial [Athelia psychrophila]